MTPWASFLAVETARRRGDDDAHAGLLGALGAAPALYWMLPLRTTCPCSTCDAPYFRDWLEHPSFDDYWRATASTRTSRASRCRRSTRGGWYDIFHAGTVANFRGIRAPGRSCSWGRGSTRPGAHTAAPREDVGANEVDDWHLRFFDEVLKGREHAASSTARPRLRLGENWRDLDDWPPTTSSGPTRTSSTPDGRANSAYGDGTRRAPARQARDRPMSTCTTR